MKPDNSSKAHAVENSRSVTTRIWSVFRELVGDDAYERYCAHHLTHHADQTPLTRSAYYLKNQQEKWNGVKRCC